MGLKRKCDADEDEVNEVENESGGAGSQMGDGGAGGAASALLGIFSGLQQLFPAPTTPMMMPEGAGGHTSSRKRNKQVRCDGRSKPPTVLRIAASGLPTAPAHVMSLIRNLSSAPPERAQQVTVLRIRAWVRV